MYNTILEGTELLPVLEQRHGFRLVSLSQGCHVDKYIADHESSVDCRNDT